MKKILILASILFLSFSPVLLAGGGWPQPKGHVYFKLYQWWVISDQHFTDNGELDPNLTIGIFNTTFYGEYGFTDRLTGIVNFPFFSRAYCNNQISFTKGETLIEGQAYNNIGDSEISLKYGLITDRAIVLSAQVTLGFPLGGDANDELGILQTGDGEFNQMLLLHGSPGFKVGETSGFATLTAGYNNRTQGFSDEFRYGAELGFNLGNFTPIVRFRGIESTFNGDGDINNNEGATFFANNVEYLIFEPELNYNLNENFGLSVGVGTALYGRLIFANPSFNAGVFYSF